MDDSDPTSGSPRQQQSERDRLKAVLNRTWDEVQSDVYGFPTVIALTCPECGVMVSTRVSGNHMPYVSLHMAWHLR